MDLITTGSQNFSDPFGQSECDIFFTGKFSGCPPINSSMSGIQSDQPNTMPGNNAGVEQHLQCGVPITPGNKNALFIDNNRISQNKRHTVPGYPAAGNLHLQTSAGVIEIQFFISSGQFHTVNSSSPADVVVSSRRKFSGSSDTAAEKKTAERQV
jgi:hypothetical protein